jgi:aryl-alcohol dehydrogenase-like predicted oxidoreductase
MTAHTAFAADDHRLFNRNGEAFDKGETFSGLDYAKGLEAVEALRPIVPQGQSMAQFALRWITMHPAVTCAIPGGKRAAQVADNVSAADLPALTEAQMAAVQTVYAQHAKPWVHQVW